MLNWKSIDLWLYIAFSCFILHLRLLRDGSIPEVNQPSAGSSVGANANKLTFTGSSPVASTVDNIPKSSTSTSSRRPTTYKYSTVENTVKFADSVWWDFSKSPLKTQQPLNFENTNILSELSRRKRVHACESSPATQTSCDRSMGDNLVRSWRASEEDYYCPHAPSRVKCYDSGTQTRFCVFDNSMLNLKRLRDVKERSSQDRSGGGGGGGGARGGGGLHTVRRFERGFLSADCGETGLTNLSYFNLYNPSIDAGGDAPCDYVFNETVIMYSHSHIYNLPNMLNDMINVFVMASTMNLVSSARDVSFFNIDGFRRGGRLFNDRPSQFFSFYKSLFRRILSLSDFEPNTNICFKRLVFPTYPVPAPFVTPKDSPTSPSPISTCYPSDKSLPPFTSALLQRFNIVNRHAHNVLVSSLSRDESSPFQIVVFKRSLSDKQSVASSNRPHLVNGLEETMKLMAIKLNEKASSRGFPVDIRVIDVSTTLYHDQIKQLANSSLLIGIESTNLLSGSNMPIGAPRCCAVLELLPSFIPPDLDPLRNASSNLNLIYRIGPGGVHRNNNNNEVVLTQFGLLYRSLSVYSDSLSVSLPFDNVVLKVEEIIEKLTSSPTCISKDIVGNPFEIV